MLRKSLVGLVSFISGIGSYFPRDCTSSVDVSVRVFSGICPSLCNTFTAKCRIIHLNQLDYKVRAEILKSQIIKCNHEFSKIRQLMDLVRVFSQNYEIPDSGIGSYFPRDGTRSVDVSVTVFSGICLSLCNTFTAKGITNSIQTINMLTMFIVNLQNKFCFSLFTPFSTY